MTLFSHRPWQKRVRLLVGLSFICVAGIGCGRVSLPIPPERTSPKPVELGEMKGTPEGVIFQWSAPTVDVRGKQLKRLYGYRIYRKPLVNPSDFIDDSIPFEVVATLPDSTLELLDKKRDEARSQNKITRKVSLSDDEKKVHFTDVGLQAGSTYVYKIIPYNHFFVEGDTDKILKVIFKGEQSEITVMDNEQTTDLSNVQEDDTELNRSDDVQYQ